MAQASAPKWKRAGIHNTGLVLAWAFGNFDSRKWQAGPPEYRTNTFAPLGENLGYVYARQ
jgi:hypothetical protein